MEKRLTLGDLLKIVLRFWYIPLVLLIIGGFLSRTYAQKKYEPIYTAKSTVIVKQKHASSNHLEQQISGELQLMPTYQDFISSDKVMEKVHKQLKKSTSRSESVTELQKKVAVITKTNSLILNIQSSDRSKSSAIKQANIVAQVFKKQIHTISSTSQVRVISKARSKSVTTSGFSGKNPLLYGAIVGAVLGVFIEFIIGVLINRKD